ncbi:hypothetical protein LCI18_013685 [Fusarium solani-melongenae]|uniref:Uncharacterized protein n=1 Tax=Fusarium solani subsp. cucurbitae TaxID=2747967 RepID=A0ACD3ZND3_FUSSC|nr:hypothetical protein LCI18_013685 [Fusarium solani-melongenae]
MTSALLPVIEPIPFVPGPPEYQSLRQALLEDFGARVPKAFRLPRSIIDDPPKNISSIPRDCGILSPEEIDITENYDVVALAEAIASKTFSAVAVATAFAKRAIIAHQLTSCLTEWFMDEAIDQARMLDAYLKDNGKPIGPLHGVPISVKIRISIAGHWAMAGTLDTLQKASKDSQLIAILRNAGAVFYCKTNQPQSLMHLETLSIWGRTLNPYNINLSSGGSSGGEAALIALRGSLLGLGTDIAGSVRGPAGYCGIFGFRPTSHILPTKDFLTGVPGFAAELNIMGCVGPMCTTLRDMDLFMNIVMSARPYLGDPQLIRTSWSGQRKETRPDATRLRIGFMMNDGMITPQPPVTRALLWVRSQLEKSDSFEIKDFQHFRTAEAMKNLSSAYWPDGGEALKRHLSVKNEPVLPLTAWAIKDVENIDIGVSGVLEQRGKRDGFRYDFAEHWASQQVDVVICPVSVGPACSHDTTFYWNYTSFWNYVDYPGATVPTPIKALKRGAEDYGPEDQLPLSDECRHVRQLWADGDFEGAPLTVQVIARRYHDDELFTALKAVNNALQA